MAPTIAMGSRTSVVFVTYARGPILYKSFLTSIFEKNAGSKHKRASKAREKETERKLINGAGGDFFEVTFSSLLPLTRCPGGEVRAGSGDEAAPVRAGCHEAHTASLRAADVGGGKERRAEGGASAKRAKGKPNVIEKNPPKSQKRPSQQIVDALFLAGNSDVAASLDGFSGGADTLAPLIVAEGALHR